MQSIFRLPWCSEHQLNLSHKVNFEKMAPMMDIPVLKDLKRKCSDAVDINVSTQSLPVKKQHVDLGLPTVTPQTLAQTPSAPSFPTPAPQPNMPASSPPTDEFCEPLRIQPFTPPAPPAQEDHDRVMNNTSDENLSTLTHRHTRLQQVIENEFNMQILMKHNELRLIEQELAKCQIALEQLRRCELRPYPGMDSPALAVTEGTGAAIAPPPGFTRPSHPAPHGVTDGPYSRHYRQWLLHDPQFDAIPPETLAFTESHVGAAARPTRNSGHQVRKSVSKSFTSATRTQDPMQSIPNYPSAPVKDKSAPLVLTRSTDGQPVKLICNNCHRGNFSSIQGFLNHCRIAHKVDYKSHDAAAIDCGHLLDAEEKANLPAESLAPKPHKPSGSRSSTSAAATPAKPQPRQHSSLVHPLNTGTKPAISAAPASRKKSKAVASVGAPAPLTTSTPFKPSDQTPRLSSFMAKHHMGGDLEQAVASAKQRLDWSVDEEMLSPDVASDPNSPTVQFGPGARTVSGNPGYFSHRPISRKGIPRPRPAPLAPAPPRDTYVQYPMSSPRDLASATLSAHSVDDPGLVSDHDDDEHSGSEEDHPQPPEVARPPLSTAGRSCSDQMEIDIEEEHMGGMDQERGVIIRRNSMLADEARGIRSGGSPSGKMGACQR
jgi:ADA HAT complex component 1